MLPLIQIRRYWKAAKLITKYKLDQILPADWVRVLILTSAGKLLKKTVKKLPRFLLAATWFSSQREWEVVPEPVAHQSLLQLHKVSGLWLLGLSPNHLSGK